MIVVNFFAGPGAGKSTTATGLFYNLKKIGINCEYVHEEAKEFTWEDRMFTLQCQPYIFAKQMRNLWRLKNKVDVAITDSPLLLSLVYVDNSEWPKSFNDYVIDQFNTFNNSNFFIKRTKRYVTTGRNQTELEAKRIDEKIYNLLIDREIKFNTIHCIPNREDTDMDFLVQNICEKIGQKC